MTTALILGGGRFIGPHLVRGLLHRGFKVVVFNTGRHQNNFEPSPNLEIIRGDRNREADLHATLKRRPDVVFDLCCYDAHQAGLVVRVFSRSIARYVYVSSVAAYRKPSRWPIEESDEIGSWPLWGRYGLGKGEAEKIFFQAFAGEGFPVTVIRPVYVLGPGNHIEREAYFFGRIINGMPVVLPGDARARVQFVFVDEAAQALAHLWEKRETVGEAYNCAGDETVTLEDFVLLWGRLLGRAVRIVKTGDRPLGFSRAPYDPSQLSPFANETCIVSNEKLKRATGMRFRTVEDGLRRIILEESPRWSGRPVALRPCEKEAVGY